MTAGIIVPVLPTVQLKDDPSQSLLFSSEAQLLAAKAIVAVPLRDITIKNTQAQSELNNFHQKKQNQHKRSRRHSKPLSLKLKVDLKGKRNPDLFKKTIRVKLDKRQIKHVLIRQIIKEEQACLKMLGVAVFYADLLKFIKASKSDTHTHPHTTSHSTCCPFCFADRSTMKVNLEEKLEKDVNYLVDYAINSSAQVEKNRYFKTLQMRGLIKARDDISFLRQSEMLLSSDVLLGSASEEEDLKLVQSCGDVVEGKKEALRLLKGQLLKSKQCGICEVSVPATNLGKILSKVDRQLMTL